MSSAAGPEFEEPRSSLLTIVAIAVAAYALCDLLHEVLGHGLAAFLVPGVRILSLSSVALQTTGSSRVVAASGSIANVLVGSAALWLFSQLRRFSPAAYFLWLSGSLNLFNGSGYPLYSAVLGYGDWEVVVRGLQPAWLWRVGSGIVGIAGYVAAVVLSSRALAEAVNRKLIARREVERLIYPAYFAGGLLLVAASALNPIGPVVILTSGVSSGFAAMAGLLVIPGMVGNRTGVAEPARVVLAPSAAWVVIGVAVGAFFLLVIGPGIQF